MSQWITLTASDGFQPSAYRAGPESAPRAGIVLLQEIFGVNQHIRSVADEYADEGYLVIAPALFDRAERGVELGYGPQERTRALDLMGKIGTEAALADTAAAIAVAREAGKVAVLGYCWGGTLAFASACRLPGLSAACGYYGGGIAKMRQETPKVPTMLHFGQKDDHIGMGDVESIKAAHRDMPVYIYPAGHGFNCSERSSFDETSAALAKTRTLAFFSETLL
jgi:carboxymethylenebutenolidase